MYSKAKIFNLALGALLLTKRISDVDSDTSVENQTLNVHYETALYNTLQDLDLDATATEKVLELIETEPTDLWNFAYKYPTDCALVRRIQNGSTVDKRSNQVKRRVAIHNGKKVIFCNEEDAILEYVKNDFDIKWLSAPAGLAVAYKLAILSSPLIVGKGASTLRTEIQQRYDLAKLQAKQHDYMENANFEEPEDMSEFVEERTS